MIVFELTYSVFTKKAAMLYVKILMDEIVLCFYLAPKFVKNFTCPFFFFFLYNFFG